MAVAEVPFDLAEVKLSAPLPRPDTVAKADVIAGLCDSRSSLVTVVAPAGYGKTTLLSRWAEADPRPFAWVALDDGDDDPVVLLRYIAGAIHRVKTLPPVVFEALTGPAASTWPERVPRVGNGIGEAGDPIVLVLDDLHLVTSPSALDALSTLLDYFPPTSQIAIASREEPALPLARWRAHGLVHEVGAADLRMGEQEAGLLMKSAGVELSAEELSELTEQTEGWPAGLYLAALSLQAGAPSSTSAEGFAGDDRFVADYFRDELLSRLAPSEARFLTRTSVLERMCGGLCDSMLETTGSANVLDALGRTNGFLVPLDRRGEWYRYHHLFGELLRNELERDEPEALPGLNRRAMEWCIANDQPEAALEYGHAAGETDTVAGLLDGIAQPIYYDGRMETVEEWLRWFDEEELARYPAIAVFGAWFRAMTGRAEEAERWLALADGADSAIPLSDGSETITPWVANLRAFMMRDGAEQALVDAEVALGQFPPDSSWRPVALLIRGVANALTGASDRARDDLTESVEQGLAAGAIDDVFVAQAELSLMAAGEGDWGEAGRRAQAAHELVEEAGLGDYSTSALPHVARARVALHEARHEDAREALVLAHRLRPMLDHAIPWLTVQVGLELTRAHIALAEPGPARTVFAETERVLEARPQLGTLVDEAGELRVQVASSSGPDGAWAMSLTGAELRLLPFLATHLTFPEIAERLFISRNTVKSEAISVYRKLGVSSRSGAIERAVEVGLLESSIYPKGPNLTPKG